MPMPSIVQIEDFRLSLEERLRPRFGDVTVTNTMAIHLFNVDLNDPEALLLTIQVLALDSEILKERIRDLEVD